MSHWDNDDDDYDYDDEIEYDVLNYDKYVYFPDIEELKKAWKTPKKALIDAVNTYKIPVLFTEYGYPSVEYAAHKPWENNIQNSVNEDLQSKAYLALYQSFWHEEWFLGGFLWKWFPVYTERQQSRDAYSPQGKDVEKVIQMYYQKK
jgi:hypothetical protein